jgi:hypothetical protein
MSILDTRQIGDFVERASIDKASEFAPGRSAHLPKTPNGSVAPAVAEGTIPIVLFTDACISIVTNRLPPVRQYSQAMATDIAVVPSR